jgi:hypothetical protein
MRVTMNIGLAAYALQNLNDLIQAGYRCFCFYRMFLLHYTPLELNPATQHYGFHATLLFDIAPQPAHTKLFGN